MATLQEVFGDALQPDPTAALQPAQIPIRSKSGPMHRLQFVVEFVGPRSVSAQSASALLSPQWFAALGEPQAFAMSPGDLEWRPMANSSAGSYDSIALAWDLVSDKGQLSQTAAQHLLGTCEQFAGHISRRAMPLPVPEDVPKAISHLHQVQENFDAGVSLLVLANSQEVSEFELWVWCAKLGLKANSAEGTFDWLVPSSPLPLFSVSPVGDTESFTLEGAQRGDQHQGVLLGFSVPRSPEPVASLESMLKAADYLAEKMWGKVYDENNLALTNEGRTELRSHLSEAVRALQQLGFPPGSSEALALFPH